jgi:ABC-type cobalamin/Fe3+-siderophores transport system ATPase subunit
VLQCLKYVEAKPRMPGASLAPLDVTVVPAVGGYSMQFDSTDTTGGLDVMLDAAHEIVRNVLLQDIGSGLLLHGASLRVGGSNVVLVGDKAAGKTTLCLKALASGIQVYGDEHVLISGSHLNTRPRTLRVKEGSIHVVTEMAAAIQECPYLVNWDDSRIYSMAPETSDVRWQLAPYSVDHFICLSPNHNGCSDLEQWSSDETFQMAMTQCFLPDEGRGLSLAALHTWIGKAKCWNLRLGNLDQAIGLLQQMAFDDVR